MAARVHVNCWCLWRHNLTPFESDAAIAVMDNYCQAHPLDDFQDGIDALVDALAR
jgi:hypothetical protein